MSAPWPHSVAVNVALLLTDRARLLVAAPPAPAAPPAVDGRWGLQIIPETFDVFGVGFPVAVARSASAPGSAELFTANRQFYVHPSPLPQPGKGPRNKRTYFVLPAADGGLRAVFMHVRRELAASVAERHAEVCGWAATAAA